VPTSGIRSRYSNERQHREQRADEGAGGDLVERVDRHAQQRVGRERDGREKHGGAERDEAERAHVRVAVGQAPAQPVPD
jgi:hypothetical protein